MSFLTIKEKIKTMLLAITEIQQVSDYPNHDFNGFPSAMVRTDGNSSEYETTNENDEIYAFTVFVFQNLDGPFDVVKSREIIEELCDTVRDTFDSDEFLNGVSLPSDRSMLGVKPTVSKIYEEESGKYVIAEIELAVRISKRV